jgi:hypothetical protein
MFCHVVIRLILIGFHTEGLCICSPPPFDLLWAYKNTESAANHKARAPEYFRYPQFHQLFHLHCMHFICIASRLQQPVLVISNKQFIHLVKMHFFLSTSKPICCLTVLGVTWCIYYILNPTRNCDHYVLRLH